MDKQEIETKLKEIALNRSEAFCYNDSIECPEGRCPKCDSDDLCRSLNGVGVGWGTSWIVEHILREELTPVNLEKAFEESVRECFPEETIVGWMRFDTVDLMKNQDPVSWRCAQSEWESEEESEKTIISFDGGSTFYSRYDLESFIEEAAS